ncbi:hypothetical protein POM88_013234 [Heracleum sosnowskyi]|uniref:Uncharacterized protein n=1 Tax=Heracleum sosnowskyi TaxID=360622 RepID=A0AAD8IZI2_9APIA|nr:hypothetical protein POM88_013234 [Heracleum sosnowskyi]
MTGSILQEVLQELGLKDIVVEEISCWKYLLIFKNGKERECFEFGTIKKWVYDMRKVSVIKDDLEGKVTSYEKQESLEVKDDNLSNISRVSDSFAKAPKVPLDEGRIDTCDDLNKRDSKGRSKNKVDLVWDYTNSLDNGDNIFQVGELSTNGSSQASLCKLLGKVQIKGPGRPKKRRNRKNPFEVGKCKLWLRRKKDIITHKAIHDFQVSSRQREIKEVELEALKIMETASHIGLTCNKGEEDTLRIIKEQLKKVKV